MFERLRKWLSSNRRLLLIIGVAVLVAGITAWAAFSGSSLEIGRFFAAEPPADSSECPVTPQGNTVTAPVISVVCGTTQNTLTWTDTESIEGVRVQLQRNSYDASGVAVAGGNLTDEVGCTGTFTVKSFTDTTAPTGLANNYVIKVGGRQNQWSNVVTCGTASSQSVQALAPGVIVRPALTGTCTSGRAPVVLTWTKDPNAPENVLRRSDMPETSIEIPGITATQTTYSDSTVVAGHTYRYFVKSDAGIASNNIDIVFSATGACSLAGATPAPTPTATVAPTPTVTATAPPTGTTAPTPTPTPTVPPSVPPPTTGTLTCTPQQQTITVGGMSEHSAQGGDGVNYRWDVSPGAVKQDGVSNFVIYSWLTPGTKTVTVTSGGDSATCTVNVQEQSGAGVVLSAGKEVRNTTAGQVTFTPSTSVWKNNVVEFSLRVAPTSMQESGPYQVTDTLPSGMTYVGGSTRLNGGQFDDPTQSGSMLIFPSFPVALGTAGTLEYKALSDRFEVELNPPETEAFEATMTDQGSGSDARAAVTLILYGRGPVAAPVPTGPGVIPTGPGDTVTFALIAAIASSLLYAAYTRSAAFRGREVSRLERDQGPMDFRS